MQISSPQKQPAKVTENKESLIIKSSQTVEEFKSNEEINFFITEKQMIDSQKEELAKLQQRNHDPYDVGISRQEFMKMIRDIEDENIFILTNIEQTEGELEQIH